MMCLYVNSVLMNAKCISLFRANEQHRALSSVMNKWFKFIRSNLIFDISRKHGREFAVYNAPIIICVQFTNMIIKLVCLLFKR